MTMYRRFCCNDLLRLAPLNLQPEHITHNMYAYMDHMGMWPGNCLVAYMPGSQIAGYVFGSIEGTGEDCYGRMTMLSCFPDLDLELTSMLEDSFDKIYNAYTIRIVIPPDDTKTIMEGEESGYSIYKYHHDKSGDQLEMMKPLPRLKGRSARR